MAGIKIIYGNELTKSSKVTNIWKHQSHTICKNKKQELVVGGRKEVFTTTSTPRTTTPATRTTQIPALTEDHCVVLRHLTSPPLLRQQTSPGSRGGPRAGEWGWLRGLELFRMKWGILKNFIISFHFFWWSVNAEIKLYTRLDTYDLRACIAIRELIPKW